MKRINKKYFFMLLFLTTLVFSIKLEKSFAQDNSVKIFLSYGE